MTKTLRILAIVAILFITIPLSQNAYGLPDGGWVEIYAPAVAETEEGMVGALSTISVRVENGSGRVFVDTFPLTEVDMQSSARLAASVAASISDKNVREYDFFVVVRSDAQLVGGTSAGGVMCVAMMAALNNLSIKKDVMMTGTINPDGTLGPVGGIPEKMQAAKEANAKKFLIPKGQANYTHMETTTKKAGPITLTTQQPRKVNLLDYGKEIGIEVREVLDVREAVYEITGRSFERPRVSKISTVSYEQLMRPQAQKLANEARRSYNKARIIEESEVYEYQNESYKSLVDGLDLLSQNRYYSAASLFFESLLYSGYVNTYDKYLKKGTYDEILEEASRSIESIDNRIKNSVSLYNTLAIQCFGAAEEKIFESKNAFNTAFSLLENNSVHDGLFSLNYGVEKARSAEWWLDVSLSLNLKGSKMSDEALSSLALSAMDSAQETLLYAQLSSVPKELFPILLQANELLTMAKAARTGGYAAGSIILALKAKALSELVVETGAVEAGVRELDEMISITKENARSAIARAQEKGIEPILALAYFECGENSEGKDALDAIMNYKYARSIASLSGYV